jgi:uncharacterized cysteine cluster protein YcgN (CxxCxxCC family)
MSWQTGGKTKEKEDYNQRPELEERGEELRRSKIKETNWKPHSSS